MSWRRSHPVFQAGWFTLEKFLLRLHRISIWKPFRAGYFLGADLTLKSGQSFQTVELDLNWLWQSCPSMDFPTKNICVYFTAILIDIHFLLPFGLCFFCALHTVIILCTPMILESYCLCISLTSTWSCSKEWNAIYYIVLCKKIQSNCSFV